MRETTRRFIAAPPGGVALPPAQHCSGNAHQEGSSPERRAPHSLAPTKVQKCLRVTSRAYMPCVPSRSSSRPDPSSTRWSCRHGGQRRRHATASIWPRMAIGRVSTSAPPLSLRLRSSGCSWQMRCLLHQPARHRRPPEIRGRPEPVADHRGTAAPPRATQWRDEEIRTLALAHLATSSVDASGTITSAYSAPAAREHWQDCVRKLGPTSARVTPFGGWWNHRLEGVPEPSGLPRRRCRSMGFCIISADRAAAADVPATPTWPQGGSGDLRT